MNKKLIALAVTGALAAPMLAQAEDSGPKLYGRINLAIGVNGDDANEDTNYDVTDVVSRFGIKGEEDLGNGLAAVYRYEFRVNADEGSLRSASEGKTQRLSYVGLKGGFGQLTLGSQWSTFYNVVGTYLDPTYTLGYFGYSSYMDGAYRIDNSIQYSGNFGPVALSTTLQLDGGNAADDAVDRWSVGGSVDVGVGTLGIAYDTSRSEDGGDTDRLGAVFSHSGEGYGVNLGYQLLDVDDGADKKMWTINGTVKMGESTSLFAQYWDGSDDSMANNDADGIVLGVYHYLSDRTKLYVEATEVSKESSDSDIKRALFGVRHDF